MPSTGVTAAGTATIEGGGATGASNAAGFEVTGTTEVAEHPKKTTTTITTAINRENFKSTSPHHYSD